MAQAVAQLLEQPHLVKVHAHAPLYSLGLRVQDREEGLVLLLRGATRCQVFTALPVYIVRPV